MSRIGTGLVEHLAGDHRRERHLGRGDRPKVVALEVVRIITESAGGRCRSSSVPHDRRGRICSEGVLVARGRIDECAQQMSAGALVHGEHRTGHLHCEPTSRMLSCSPTSQMGTLPMLGIAVRIAASRRDDVVALVRLSGASGAGMFAMRSSCRRRWLTGDRRSRRQVLSRSSSACLVLQCARLIALAVAMQPGSL